MCYVMKTAALKKDEVMMLSVFGCKEGTAETLPRLHEDVKCVLSLDFNKQVSCCGEIIEHPSAMCRNDTIITRRKKMAALTNCT